MSTGQRQYQYKPLASKDQIRLLQFIPTIDKKHFLHCSVKHIYVHHGAKQGYCALSYEWGVTSEETNSSIIIDEYEFPIRKNLKDALDHLIPSIGDKLIWIDAICINHDDPHERAAQVQLMGRIFSEASHVLVWLEPAANKSDIAMSAIDEQIPEIIKLARKQELASFGRRSLQSQETVDQTSSKTPALSVDTLRAILALFSRRYWHRVWIIQEMQLARLFHVQCGTKSVTASRLREAYIYFGDRSRASNGLNQVDRLHASILDSAALKSHICPLMRYREDKHRPSYIKTLERGFREWLFSCLLSTNNFQATEPRDYVYAIIGLSQDLYPWSIVVDYEKPVEEGFFDAMRKCQKNGYVLRVEKEDMKLAKRLGTKMGIIADDIEELLQAWTLSLGYEEWTVECNGAEWVPSPWPVSTTSIPYRWKK